MRERRLQTGLVAQVATSDSINSHFTEPPSLLVLSVSNLALKVLLGLVRSDKIYRKCKFTKNPHDGVGQHLCALLRDQSLSRSERALPCCSAGRRGERGLRRERGGLRCPRGMCSVLGGAAELGHPARGTAKPRAPPWTRRSPAGMGAAAEPLLLLGRRIR